MKLLKAIWIVPALAIGLAAPVAADDNDDRKEKNRNRVLRERVYDYEDDGYYGARGRNNRNMRFRGMDRNGDGVITRSEWRGNTRSFRQHDLNRDGVLAGREVWTGMGSRDVWDDSRYGDSRYGTVYGSGTFGQLDRNRNGVLESHEWPYAASDFYRFDRNGNRVIESWEYR